MTHTPYYHSYCTLRGPKARCVTQLDRRSSKECFTQVDQRKNIYIYMYTYMEDEVSSLSYFNY